MRLKHHKQIVDILYDEWDLGKSGSGAKGKTCAWIYWFEVLSESEQIIIEKQNGDAVGVCGYSKRGSKKHLFRKRYYKALSSLLKYSPLIKNRKGLEEYLSDYDYAPKSLENHFDGEVTLLIVKEELRGKKIGGKLLTQVFELARADGLNNLEILTDESCNFKFYERMGCKKVYEKTIPNGESEKCTSLKTEQGFIYEKKLDEPSHKN